MLGEPPIRLGNRHPVHAPQGVYRCLGEDQWVALTVETDDQWRALSGAIAGPELTTGFGSAGERRDHHDLIDKRISVWAGAREREEVLETILLCGIPTAGVLDVNEVLAHPQLEAREFWQWMEREHVGMQPNPVAPYRTGPAPNQIDWPAPTLGEQSREVLGKLLGLSEPELDGLEKQGVIGTEARIED